MSFNKEFEFACLRESNRLKSRKGGGYEHDT